jgi:excisionase family DNA binding protein
MAEEARLLVDADEAARRLSVSKRTVQALLYSGQLRGVKVGRCRRIPVSELTIYVERLRDE